MPTCKRGHERHALVLADRSRGRGWEKPANLVGRQSRDAPRRTSRDKQAAAAINLSFGLRFLPASEKTPYLEWGWRRGARPGLRPARHEAIKNWGSPREGLLRGRGLSHLSFFRRILELAWLRGGGRGTGARCNSSSSRPPRLSWISLFSLWGGLSAPINRRWAFFNGANGEWIGPPLE